MKTKLLTLVSLIASLAGTTHAQLDAPGGTLNVPRYLHSATRLADGRVLIAGGLLGPTDSCEIYDPAANRWIKMGSLNMGRYLHQAVLLSDGRVLIMGGQVFGANPTDTAELYDPATGRTSLTANMLSARFAFDATLLTDGKVLVIGGSTGGATETADCELFDPDTETWSRTGSLLEARSSHHATMLFDQRVLVAGGFSQSDELIMESELYDSVTGTWISSGSLNRGRIHNAQVLLSDGRVLVAGGFTRLANPFVPSQTCEIYDPVTGLWSQSGKLRVPRVDFTANLLPNGRVFVVGGSDGTALSYDTVEEYRPGKDHWDILPHTLVNGRRGHTTSTLLNGSLIIAGGLNSSSQAIADAELVITPR